MNRLLTILVTLSLPTSSPDRQSGLGSSTPGPGVGVRLPHTFLMNSCMAPYLCGPMPTGESPRPTPGLGQDGFPAGCCRLGLEVPTSAFHRASELPVCSTTLKRLDRPSFRPLRTGESRVVVERAQAEPQEVLRWWRLQRLRSRAEEALVVELVSSLEEEADTRRCSLGEPYLGEQQGRSMRLATFSSEEEIWRERADAREEDGRGDQLLPWSPVRLAAVPALGPSVCIPTLTRRAVCVPVLLTPTV